MNVKTLLNISSIAFISSYAALPSFAAAQEAPQPENAAIESGDNDIVVTGSIVESQRDSVDQKRNADNLTEIVSADAAGRFPDQNTAAVLARLPAIAVQRDQGQERYIQVRGAPNRWSSVSFDGIPVIGVDEGGETRAFRFDAVPAVLLSSIAVNKSLTPDLTAEAVVANIDLRTYSPLSETGLHVKGDIGYGYQELGGGEQRQGSIRASWANDVVGLVVGGSHYQREQTTDNREVGAYDEPTSATDTQFGPTEIDIRSYRLTRQSNGAFAGIEYEPVEGQKIFANVVFSQFHDNELRDQYELRLDRASSGTRNLNGGELFNVPVRGTFNDGEYDTKYYIATVGGDYENEGFVGKFRFNYTRSENTTFLPLLQVTYAARPSLTYDFSEPRFPIVQLFNTVAGSTAGTFARGTALTTPNLSAVSTAPGSVIYIPARQDTFSDSYTVKADFSKEIGDVTFAGGFSYADRDIDGFTFATANIVQPVSAFAGVGLPFNPTSFATTNAFETGFPLGFDLNYIDNRQLRRDLDAGIAALTAAGRYNPAADVPDINRYALNEQLLTGYALAKFVFDGGQVIAGTRVERFVLANTGTAALGGGRFERLSAPLSYTDFYPSVNAKFDVSDDFIVRLSGQRSVSRPSFGQIRVGSSINDTASPGTIGGGNPGLAPEYTWGVDASFEYYLPGSGILAISGFHRWVENVLYSNTQAVGSDFFDSNGTDRSAYQLTSTFNGQNGRLYGVELNYQQQFTFLPSPLDGFGFQGNLTFLDGEFETNIPGAVNRTGLAFPGTSDTIVNASFYYEKYGFSARLSYQYRSDWLDTLGGFGTGGTGDEFRDAYDNLDLSVRYKLTDNFTLFADLSNLTDAVYTAYQGNEGRPTEVEQIGRRYLFGVRFGF
ncbi:MAG: TonB-dependent receptor [Sphingorhabdus sp.]|nr:TonB-dependent receptor [Sphingorhabdus sp.]